MRYQSGWGVSAFGNWGASTEAPTYVLSPTDHAIQAVHRLLAQYQGHGTTLSATATVSSNVATISLAAGHNVIVGQQITTSGFGVDLSVPTAVLSVGDTSLTVPLVAPDGSNGSGSVLVRNNMIALAESVSANFQALENAGQSVLQLRSLDTGFGASLDGIGDLLLLQRGGVEDNVYRVLLQAKAMAASSYCTPEEVRAIADFLMQGLQSVRLMEEPPAVLVLRTSELPQADGARFANLLAGSVPTATRVILEYEVPGYVGHSFGWEDDNTVVGWAEYADDTGEGSWAEGSDGGASTP